MGYKSTQRRFRFIDPGLLQDRELQLTLVARQPAMPEKGFVPAYKFEMRVGGAKVGSIDLRAGTTEDIERYGGHVGYSVAPAHRGNHYAARSLRLLLGLARDHGIDPVWITCNSHNIASRRTCDLAGAVYVETVRLPETNDMYRDGDREKCRYSLSTGQIFQGT